MVIRRSYVIRINVVCVISDFIILQNVCNVYRLNTNVHVDGDKVPAGDLLCRDLPVVVLVDNN